MIGLKEQQIVFNMGKVRDVSLDAKLYYEFSFSPIVLSSKKRVMVVWDSIYMFLKLIMVPCFCFISDMFLCADSLLIALFPLETGKCGVDLHQGWFEGSEGSGWQV